MDTPPPPPEATPPPAPAPTIDYGMLGGDHALRGQRLFKAGVAALVVLLFYLVYSAQVDDPLHLAQGIAITILSVLPALLWARTGGSRFPVIETLLLQCMPAYAFPLLNGSEQLAVYSQDVVTRAGWTVILYLLTANLAYNFSRGRPARGSFWQETLISPEIEQKIVYGMLLCLLYVAVSEFTTWIPREVASLLRAIFYGGSILCTFVSAQCWGRGELSSGQKMLFVLTLVPQLILMSVSLILISAIALLGVALLGYVSGGKRIPWVVMVICFLSLAVLHTGKTRMREKYWDGKTPAPSFAELPAYFSEWVGYGLAPTSGDKSASQKMLERTSLIHLLCLIINVTPDRQDYLYGSTYTHVLPQLIPRFFWEDKPRSHIATYQLGIYYGLQREEDTLATTIAFGLLAEAYANFGLVGAVLLGCFWGLTLRKLQLWSASSPMFSFAGLFMILLTAWSLNSELTMAAWVSSFFQAVLMVLGAPLLLRSLIGK